MMKYNVLSFMFGFCATFALLQLLLYAHWVAGSIAAVAAVILYRRMQQVKAEYNEGLQRLDEEN